MKPAVHPPDALRCDASITRRTALKAGATALAGGLLAAPRASAAATEGDLRVAAVGVGGKGWSDLAEVASASKVRITALCDVDSRHLARAADRYDGAATFADYRRMFEQIEREIDAVVIATPDHMHAAIALAAMDLGKHVYVEKPLAHNLREVRRLQQVAADKRLVTQMGIQVHNHAAYRTAAHWLAEGVIGRVQKGYAWVGANWAATSPRPTRKDPVPDYLDWNLWLGVAPHRPYADGAYHPENWRRWCDFGTGSLGDMGCHLLDPVKSGLDLAAPTRVVSHGSAHSAESYAGDGHVEFTFPATPQTAGELTLHWMDGTRRPSAEQPHLSPDFKLPGGGSLLVGEQGTMVTPHWSLPTVYRDGQQVDVELERLESRNHYHQWANACRGEGSTSAPFSYAAPLAETVLTGVVAARFPEQTLHWNTAQLTFDHHEANAWVERQYRIGWEL